MDSHKTEKLKIEIPTQGWRQILSNRKEMLDSFDKAKEQSKIHKVQTYHGKVAEAECRKWLANTLPKRYGVTPGYIVSPGQPSREKTPHFDVIVYDQMESPILWSEDNPDSSMQGRSLAIPVEFVYAVLEVKSAFTPKDVKDAITHLKDLEPLMKGPDSPKDRYKLHLPPTFSCGLVFFELREEQFFSETALIRLLDGVSLRGFFGGIILRFDGATQPQSGHLSINQSDTKVEGFMKGRETPLLEVGRSDSIEIAEKHHIFSKLEWSESKFSQFSFDLIAMMQGKFEANSLTSFYGIGNSFVEMIRELEAE